MLRIQRSSSGGVVFSLSGRIETEDVAELHRVLSLEADRKSTRLNSSHQIISYAVFCLKKKKTRLISCHKIIPYAGSSLGHNSAATTRTIERSRISTVRRCRAVVRSQPVRDGVIHYARS